MESDIAGQATNICKPKAQGKIGNYEHELHQPLTKDASVATIKLSAALAITCEGSGAKGWTSAAQELGCSDNSAATGIKTVITRAKLFEGTPVGGANLRNDGAATDPCKVTEVDDTKFWPNQTDVADAARLVEQRTKVARDDLQDLTLSSLKGNTKFKDIIRQLMTTPTADEDFKKKFITELSLRKAKVCKGGELKTEKYEALSGAADAAAANAYGVAERVRKEEAKMQAIANQAAKASCGGREKKKCNGECKWEGTDDKGECKPKAVTENRQTGTEGAAGETAASTGCEKHGTDNAACENDKKGDKQNCA
uniref:Variant surface glycoprotein 1125.2847 n=1 Tax=Trypanosoma brucei TaxID=5691 RepID=A0A1J0R902_9TRYP|nr:variant surface glycoprotein 1125.2847 [Trypanosoma brucei]